MYDFKLNDNEEIVLISDNTKINDKYYSSVITTKRLLILDYPDSYQNSKEELRILNRMNYIKMKEIIFESYLKDIKEVKNNEIIFMNDSHINIIDNDIITKLKKKINDKQK